MDKSSEFDSFAIYASCNSGEDISLSIDVNVWINRKQGCDFDLGINIPPTSEPGIMTIYVPYQLSRKQIADLSYLLHDRYIYRAIFNENKVIGDELIGPGSPNYPKDSNFAICSLSLSDLVLKRHAQGGSVLQFRFNDNDQISPKYYRFRFPIPPLDLSIASAGDLREAITGPIIPFRTFAFIEFNQLRGLPEDIGHALICSQSKNAKVKLALVVDTEWTVEAWRDPYKVRQLETQGWGNYQKKLLPSSHSWSQRRHRFTVYQWEEVNRSSVFEFCLSRKVISIKTILFYLSVLVGVELITNALVTCVQILSPILIDLASKCMQGVC